MSTRDEPTPFDDSPRNAEQRDAVAEREGSLALAANAGSGKTSVLVERFVRAVTKDGIAPTRILAITFTERAAGELRERIRNALLAAGERAAAHETAAAPISTFHAFALRLLRAHPLLAALPPDFVVLDDAETATLRELAFRAALALWQERDGALDLAATFGIEPLRVALLGVYDERRSRGEEEPRLPAPGERDEIAPAAQRLRSAARDLAVALAQASQTVTITTALDRLARAGEPPLDPLALAELKLTRRGTALQCAEADAYEEARSALEQALADERAAAAVPLLDELLREFAGQFAALKQARGGADFDDLELAAARLLREHPAVARAVSERFDRLMVDELQDTNPRQMQILALLDRDNLFTVGDAFQSIYAFRHASVEIFRERFTRLEPRGRALVLSANFRSRTPILDAVNTVFAQRFGEQFVALRAGRADAAGGPAVELIVVDTDGWQEHAELLGAHATQSGLWRTAEARLLAARIDELIEAGEAAPGEIAVLLRAAGEIAIYENEIAALGHATLTPAGAGFYARPEIADLAAYVGALANPLDGVALYGALASPLCGADSDALVALALRAREEDLEPYEALASDEQLGEFAARFAAARAVAPTQGLGELVSAAVLDSGFEDYLCQLTAAERRVANVRKLIRLAREFERRHGRDLRRFADALAAGRLGSLHESEAPPPLGGAIRLMTVHAAKGLEFPVVCLADLGHRPNTDLPRILTDGVRVGLRLPTIERSSVEALDYSRLAAERHELAAQEEERIFYVAMTRARERLIMSGAARLAAWPSPRTSPLGWLGPALIPDLPTRAAGGALSAELVAGVKLTLVPALALESSVAAPVEPAAPAVPARVAPAQRPPAGPDHVSYTALADYERCGYRYYLQRVLNMPDVQPPPAAIAGASAADRGTLVHALLEAFDFASPREPDAATVAATAATLGLPDALAGVAELAGAFALSPLCARLAAARDVRREHPFAFALAADAELLRGTFDVVGSEADGTLLVVDYKSDALLHGEDLRARLERDYGLQRLVYAIAALSTGAQRVEVAHCFLHSPQTTLAARHTQADREPLERALARRLASLRASDFTVTQTPGRQRCATCPGRARLCSYDESLTLA